MFQYHHCHRTSPVTEAVLLQQIWGTRISAVPATWLSQQLHCRSPSTVSGTPLLQDLHFWRFSTLVSPPQSWNLHWCSTYPCPATSNDAGYPLSQENHCHRASNLNGPLLFNNLRFLRTTTVTGPPLWQSFQRFKNSNLLYLYWQRISNDAWPQIPLMHDHICPRDFHCPINFTIPAPPILQDFQCQSNCTVLGPQLVQDLQCCRTFKVPWLPLSQVLHPHWTSPLLFKNLHNHRSCTVSGSSLFQHHHWCSPPPLLKNLSVPSSSL